MPEVPPAPLILISGPESLLVRRAVAGIVAQARRATPGLDVRHVVGGALDRALLLDLASPSLFGDASLTVVADAQDLAEDVRDALIGFLPEIDEGIGLVLCHSGVTKGKALVDAVTAAGAHIVRAPAVKTAKERVEFVQVELRSAGKRVDRDVAQQIVDAVGNDLEELAGACAQLAVDVPGALDEEAVARYYRGRAETSGFQIADATVVGDLGGALTLLRQALQTGTPHLLVTSALSGSLRDMARAREVDGHRLEAAARDLRMPAWKLRRVIQNSRGWTDEGLVTALRAAARADLEVKGGADDATYALERAVVAIARARGRRSGR